MADRRPDERALITSITRARRPQRFILKRSHAAEFATASAIGIAATERVPRK